MDPWVLTKPKPTPDTFLLLFGEWRTLWILLTHTCYLGKHMAHKTTFGVNCNKTQHAHWWRGESHTSLHVFVPSQLAQAAVRTCTLWGEALWAGRSGWGWCSRGWPRRCRNPAAPCRAAHSETQKCMLATTSWLTVYFSSPTIKVNVLICSLICGLKEYGCRVHLTMP